MPGPRRPQSPSLPKKRKIGQAVPRWLTYTLGLEALMILWKRAAVLGLLSWLIPFAISFLLFPLKQPNAALFETLMNLILLLTGGALLSLYFRNRSVALREAVLVGALWVAMNLMFD